MGLIQNGYRDVCGSFRLYGATVHNSAVPQESVGNRHLTGMNRNLTAGEGITDDTIGVPVGYRPPDTWIMPQKAGALGATGSRLVGTGSVASPGNLAGGLNAESTLEGTGGIDSAAMGLVMSALASITGTGGFTADIVGNIAAAAELAGISSLSAPLGAIAGCLAVLAGNGGVCCSDLRADAFMSADIAPATTVAASVIANAVWAAVAADSGTPGSMGEAVLASGGGLVPPTPAEVANAVWQHLTDGSYTAEEVLRLVSSAMAGKVTGADTSIIKFRDLADTKDRISATVDDKGNRTEITYDVL